MCSVRHRPMPWAPNRRARAASSAVSALARTPSRRRRVGVRHDPVHGADQLVGVVGVERCPRSTATTGEATTGHLAEVDLAGRAVDRDHVALADDDLAVARRGELPRVDVDVELLGAAHAGLAHAAGDDGGVARSCRRGWSGCPRAAIMPCRSSGLVSRRTRMTSSPRSAHSTAVAGVEDGLADGRAGRGAHRPWRSAWRSSPGVEPGEHQLGELVAGDPAAAPRPCRSGPRRPAGWRSGTPPPAVRLPTRVCSIHSLPRSIVNSMSHRSL